MVEQLLASQEGFNSMELGGCYLTTLVTPRLYNAEDRMIDEHKKVHGMRTGRGN
jgi:hypothetical protein